MPEFIDFEEICDECLNHVIAESRHDFCNQFCKPPFHSGGGTWPSLPTERWQVVLMTAAMNKHHFSGCCKELGCVHK